MATKKHVILEMNGLHVRTQYGYFFEAMVYEIVIHYKIYGFHELIVGWS